MNLLHIIELLREEDPDEVVELLDLSTDQIVDAFLDVVEERIEYLRKFYE
jgi:hypothetical protein